MAGRNVTATLSANVSGYVAAMNRAAQATQQFASRSSAAVGKNRQGIEQLSHASGLIGIAATAGVVGAVKSFADFDEAMSSVAATGSDARANLSALRDTAIQAGAATKYSATEAAGGVEALAKAGVSAKDTLGGGLTGALNLAAAGNLGVAGSAEAAASAMNQFGLSGRDVPHIADLLAQAAGTAQGEVSDLAAGLQQSGLVANQFGLSIDETAQSLALFAKNGLTGSDAGTSFKTMLTSLYAPSGAAAQTLTKLGVSAYDAQGALKPIGTLADDLKAKLDGLSAQDRNQALKNIFGSDAIRAGTILLRDGSAGLAQVAADFGRFGSAADVAGTKMNNLKGDLEQFKGSVETALIGLGQSADGPFRKITQGATDAVNAFNDLGDGSKAAILGVGGGLATIAVSAAAIGKVAVFANEAKGALAALGVTAKVAGIATAGIGGALGVAALAFGLYASKAAESKARVDSFTEALNSQTDSIQKNVTATAAKQLLDAGAADAARQLGLDLAVVTQASLGNADAMARVGKATGDALALINTPQEFDSNSQASIAAAQKLQDAVGRTGSEYNKAVSGAKDFAAATGQASDASRPDVYDTAAAALGKVDSSAAGASTSVTDLANSLFAVNNAALATSNSQIAFEQAVDAAAEAAKKNGDNLKVSTAAGRENRSALNQLAAAGQSYVQSLVEQGGSAKKVASATKEARNAFVDNAKAMGLSTPAAKKLADQYGLIPKNVRTKVEVDANKAKSDTAKVEAAIKGLPKSQQTEIRSAYKKGGIEAAKAKLGELKDKTVTAGTNSDLSGAKRTQDGVKAVHGKTVEVDTKSNLSGAKKTQGGVNAVKGKTVTVATKADTSGAQAAQAALDKLHNTTVYATVIKNTITTREERKSTGATGGLMTSAGFVARGPLQRSRGGPVWGAGTATSDSIPALLSNGEFVIRAAAAKVIGTPELMRLNSQGYASGGLVGRFASGGLVTTDIAKLIAALQDPLSEIRKAAAVLASANAKIAKPTARKVRAEQAYEKARDRQESLRDRVNRLAKEAAATKGITKADRDLKRARLALSDANNKVSKTSREKTAATKAYNDVAGPSKDATEALVAAQKALADTARGVSDSFRDSYLSASTDARDLIQLAQDGAQNLTAFAAKINTLRKLGLNETTIQQAVSLEQQNQGAGSELAQQIVEGGRGLVDALNKANSQLQKAADSLGYTSATGSKRYATGGLVVGAGSGTSDSVSAPWLSNGEWVVPARAVPANRAALEQMTYGRQVVEHTYVRSHYAAGGPVRLPAIDMGVVRGALAGMRIEGRLDVTQDQGWLRGVVVDVLDDETAKARTSF